MRRSPYPQLQFRSERFFPRAAESAPQGTALASLAKRGREAGAWGCRRRQSWKGKTAGIGWRSKALERRRLLVRPSAFPLRQERVSQEPGRGEGHFPRRKRCFGLCKGERRREPGAWRRRSAEFLLQRPPPPSLRRPRSQSRCRPRPQNKSETPAGERVRAHGSKWQLRREWWLRRPRPNLPAWPVAPKRRRRLAVPARPPIAEPIELREKRGLLSKRGTRSFHRPFFGFDLRELPSNAVKPTLMFGRRVFKANPSALAGLFVNRRPIVRRQPIGAL